MGEWMTLREKELNDENERLTAELAAERELVDDLQNKLMTEGAIAYERVAKLREALEPFAKMLMSYHAGLRDDRVSEVSPRVGDLRRARAVLAETGEKHD